jgi:hypothetical protein
MRSHLPAQDRYMALDLEVCDEEGRVVDHVTVRDLSGSYPLDGKSRHRGSQRRHRSGH